MSVPIFESQDIPIECYSKRVHDGPWFHFMWEPSLSINGQTPMSAIATIYDDNGVMSDFGRKDDLVESIRLASIKEIHDHYAEVAE